MILKTIKTFLGPSARTEWVKRGLFWEHDKDFLTVYKTDYWTEEYLELEDEIVKIVYIHERVEELHILTRCLPRHLHLASR